MPDTATGPKRIQRQRAKGWRMPEGAVYVGRPTKWGNPFEVARAPRFAGISGPWFVRRHGHHDRTWTPEDDTKQAATELAVTVYRGNLGGFWNADFRAVVRTELAGRDLACWCPLDQPCHADVLLEIANSARPTTTEGA